MAADIKARREAAGLTQLEVADRCGVGWSAIARIEIGARRPSLPMLETLAGVFGCRVVDLIPERGSVRKVRVTAARKGRAVRRGKG